MTLDILLVLLLIGAALFLFVTEWLAIDTVSILVMLAFMVTGILTPEEGFSGFTNPATVTVAAMFVLSAAVFRTGALNRVGELLIRTGRRGYLLLSFTLMTVVGLLSGFINNTAAVALLIPVILDVARQTGVPASRLLMPLSFGAILGGACTLIGTSTNILVSGIAVDRGLPGFGMFELTAAGLVFFGVGVAYMLLTERWLLPKRELEDSYQERYDIGSYLTEVEIRTDSSLVGMLLPESPLVTKHRIEVVKLIPQEGPPPESLAEARLQAGDVLRLRCQVGELSDLIEAQEVLIMMESRETFSKAMTGFQLFEALIPPFSSFVDRTLEGLQFRDRYNGATVLGIRSRKRVIRERIEKVKLHSGDILLIRAEPRLMRRFHDNDDLVVLSEIKEEENDQKPSFLPALLVLAGVIAAAALDLAPIVLTASVGVLLLILLRLIRPEDAYEAIDWKVIFMLGGVLTMGTALEKTGADQLLADVVTGELGQFGPRWVLTSFFILTMVTSNVMSNNAAGALMAPIAITVAAGLGVSERPFLMAVTFAASLSFILPMGYQTNTMIYTPGEYRVRDYVRVGAPLSLLLCIVAHFLLPLLFPF